MTKEVDDVKVAVGALLDAVPLGLQQIQDEVTAILNAASTAGLSQADKDSLEASAASVNSAADSIKKAVADAQAALAPPAAPAPDAPAPEVPPADAPTA